MRRALPLALAAVALGAAAPAAAGDGSSLAVSPKPGDAKRLTLVAHLRGGSAGTPVAFFVVSREFGQPREVPIGVTKAGKDGAARLVYAPTWNGAQRFVARLDRSGAKGAAASAEYRVTTSKPGPLAAGANPGRPLASVGRVFLDVILSVVALVWLSLFVTLVLAFGRLPRLARGAAD